MNITELRLTGFKSFVETARAPIEPGLTGVVGPNGCGKSNLLEAVRWVMGATSAKSMRAADMEDVIFSGAAGRPAREHAEVTLVLSEAAGRAPAPFHNDELLEVSRRIRRGLGSTYRINGKDVRAKDVQLLFADAATGANSPALVRQGQISELIAAKPQNRRRILEDAAGISGLHARRHEADLKLRAAEANLARLDEVLAEIQTQALSLKKQARQAERYRGLAQTLRETEALLLHRRWIEARERDAEAQTHLREAERAVAQAASEASAAERAAEDARQALGPLREQEAVAAAVLRRLEGVRVGLERDLAQAQAAIERCDADAARARDETARLQALEGDAQEALARLAAEAETLAPQAGADGVLAAAEMAEKQAVAQRAEAEAHHEALAQAAAAGRARAQALAQTAAQARSRLDRANARKAETDSQLAALTLIDETALSAARAKAEAANKTASEAREALNGAEGALKKAEAADEAAFTPFRAAEGALKELEAEVRALDKLAPPVNEKFPPVLAAIEVQPGYERALAAALGDDLDVSTNGAAPAHWAGAQAPAAQLPPAAQPLSHYVKAPPALAARIALIGVVEAKEGASLAKQLPPGVRLVSKAGDLWRWDGLVRRSDAPQPAAARLEHKNRLAAARAELASAEEKLARAKAAWENAKADRAALDAKARTLRAQAPQAAAAAAQAVLALDKLQAEHARQAERRADLQAQAQAAQTEIAEANAAMAEAQNTGAGQAVDDAAIAAARASVETARAAAAQAAATTQSLVRERSLRANRLKAIAAETLQWRARIDSSGARLTMLSAELNEIEQRRDMAKAAPQEARAKLEALLDEAGAAEARRKGAADAVAEAETAARLAAEVARGKDQAHASARERRAAAQAHAVAASQRVEDVVALAREQADCAPQELGPRAGPLLQSPLGQGPLTEIERRFDRLKSERDAAGPVNLRAEEELAEAQARIDSLTTEKADVAAAVAKLRGAITKLNNEGRLRLTRAFEEVDAHFAQLFATLFEGGRANLKLTENEDPLEAGLEIFAEPPGKRLTNLSLMSGGEQALTATALIFAVFLANPAPLCVLDEVDAPLDDANVDRFCSMLDEMKRLTRTRFIVITHNPVTMSRMDRLYGVTMPEQGLSQLVSVDLTRAQALAAE